MWWVMAVCVCLCALGVLVNHLELRSHIRDMQIGREKEERDRATGALPYDYLPRKRGDKR